MKMKKNDTALILFARNPDLGRVKSRLSAALGEKKALLVYERLLSHTLKVAGDHDSDKFIFLSEYLQESLKCTNSVQLLQSGSDLGERMENAVKKICGMGFEKICIIGADCPDISCEILNDAFKALDKSDAVFGPSHDGGYYLIGLTRLIPHIFSDIEWGTDSVLETTLSKLDASKISFQLLKKLYDIDTYEDIIVSKHSEILND